MKKDITNAGSGPDPTKDVNDKLEISPVTEAAAASLDQNKTILDSLNEEPK